MKILVTGGAGFIGSHVVDAYLKAGHEVVVVDNLATGRRANLNPAARFYQADIRHPDLEAVFAAEKPQVVNHHAAQINVRRSVAEPLYDAEVNIIGSIRLLELCRQYGVQQVIYSSSGGAAYGEPEYLPCDEAHPVRPVCQYGASKYSVEQYLYLYHELYGLNYTALRYGNVYGPRQDPAGEAGVISIFISQMLAGEPAVINGDGRQSRDFVYVADCARANVAALEQAEPALTVNIGNGEETTINDLYRALAAITGYSASPAYGPALLGETRHIYLSVEKAKQTLGWEPETTLPAGLEQSVAYFRSQKPGF